MIIKSLIIIYLIFCIIQYLSINWLYDPKLRNLKMKSIHLKLYDLTKDLIEKMKNVKMWAIGGTMLGAARNGKIIEWDDDIDFAYDVKDNEKIKLIDWSSIGITLETLEKKDFWMGFKVHRDNVSIDLFQFEEIENDKMHYSGKGKQFWAKQFFLKHELNEIVYIPFGSNSIPVAKNFIPYLERSFSKQWDKKGKIVPPHMCGRIGWFYEYNPLISKELIDL